MESRRDALKLALLGGLGWTAPASSAGESGEARAAQWGRGIESQRTADLGDGHYLNPIMSGDHPDPTILRDGDDYYMTFSSFESHPALLIWHSRDLINWQPLGAALPDPHGSVFAVDLCKHGGRYFIYIPIIPTALTSGPDRRPRIFVIHAPKITGPWSEPVALDIAGYIDPGHAVGEDGKRYLFLSGVARVRLADDGLAVDGPVQPVYEGWRYPDDWIVEAFALEGPKITHRGEWYYLISAVGGTAGPPTGHMVIAARSRSIHGPWENCPHNPIVRTRDAREPWWSRGHATVFEGPGGHWWMVYHGFENGYRTLGRQTLLEPIEWTSDGWFRTTGSDLSVPLSKPQGVQVAPHGVARSDDFSSNVFGVRWSFYQPGSGESGRVRFEEGALVLSGKGSSPADCSPVTGLVGEHRL